jgi:hypothetical protein
MTDQTREHHGNPDAEPGDVKDTHAYDENIVQDTVMEVHELMGLRTAIENYRDQVVAAGRDGLDPLAKSIMQVNLRQIGLGSNRYGLEAFGEDGIPSVEDFKETLDGIGAKIMAFIEKLIAHAKVVGAKIMSGISSVTTKAEELIDKARTRGTRASTELHGDEQEVTINSPGLLFADGEFCIDDCRSEQEVIKFFINTWPKYAVQQIERAKKMITEYDVESGNSENFTANSEFIGNHQSLADTLAGRILPGNKEITFKYVALGPELVNAENAQAAPDAYTYTVRTNAEIQGTLRKNIASMNALGKMFSEEADIYRHMGTLSKAVGDLEGRRGETVWKSAREDLDAISTMMMDLIVRLKPNYEPIVSYLGKVGAARNAACQQELNASR